MIYMFNAVFDTRDFMDGTNGRFTEADDDGTQPLSRSLAWLGQGAQSGTPDPTQNNDWAVVSLADGEHLSVRRGDQIWMRVCGLNAGGLSTRITTLITRDAKRATTLQQRASPFALDDSNVSRTVFDSELQTAASDGSWILKLGVVTFFTGSTDAQQKLHDAYHLILAATVGEGTPEDLALSNLRTYAHDPEFDVDGGR